MKARVGALGEISPAVFCQLWGAVGCFLLTLGAVGCLLLIVGGCRLFSADDCAGLQAVCMHVGTRKHHTYRCIHTHTHVHAHTCTLSHAFLISIKRILPSYISDLEKEDIQMTKRKIEKKEREKSKKDNSVIGKFSK